MKVPADEIKKKVDWAIDILGLEEYRYRKPKEFIRLDKDREWHLEERL